MDTTSEATKVAAEKHRRLQACALIAWQMLWEASGKPDDLPPPDPDRNPVEQALEFLDRVREIPKYAAKVVRLEAEIRDLLR
jgi:hypothetical protein